MLPITIMMIIVCVIMASLAIYFGFKIKKSKIELEKQHKEQLALNNDLSRTQTQLSVMRDVHDRLDKEITENRCEITALAIRKKDLNSDIATQVENIEKLKESYQTTEEEFKKKYMLERKEWLDKRQEEYLQMQNDFVDQFREENSKKLAAAQELTTKLDTLRSEANAAVEVAKRHAEEENFIEFHSLQMGENVLNDIRKLEEIVPSISQEAGDAIAKVIWKVYYEKPYTDLVGRTIGSGRHTGIYRITNINTQMCYVGQAVDIADRWRQHIKRAIGAEPRTQNKLYPAMYKEGLENFTFEIIEECDQSQLNRQEDYWQEFYKAKEYGYSIK